VKREKVFKRDRYRCVYCGVVATAPELTVDHVEPRMRGGDQSEGNLVTACRACNTLKGGEAAWSYLSRNDDLRAHFLASVADADVQHAQPVWPRLIRAIEDAARSARKVKDR
jgi:hypothetical protein